MEFATADLRDRLLSELRRATSTNIAVAYFNPDPETLAALQEVKKLRLLVSSDFQINNPDTLEVLHRARKWVRAVCPELHGGNLHAKVYIVERRDKTRWAMVGSANLTRSGLSTSQEACVIFDDNKGDGVALDEIRVWLDELMGQEYEPIDFRLARAIFATRNRQNAGGVRTTATDACYWALKPGYCGEFWEEFQAENVIAMGWEPMPDTSGMDLEGIQAAYRAVWPDDTDGTVSTNSRQIQTFTQEMGVGDLVFLCGRWDSTPTGSPNVYLYGIARTQTVGGCCYFYDSGSDWWHFKRHATIQKIEEHLPKELVATAVGVGAFVPTIRALTRAGIAGLEAMLRRELGFVVNV